MNKINIGLIGYGIVGQGVAQILHKQKKTFKNKFHTEFVLKTICDRSIHKKNTQFFKKTCLTKNSSVVLNDDTIDVVIELIGGKELAKTIVESALKSGKHVITANKDLIANHGKELFALAKKYNTKLYFESAVGAGIPIIKTITEGIAGNSFNGLYGIINGTCNFILDEMTHKNLTFETALQDAQEKGYAESDPTLDINGMDTTHKLAILIYCAFGRFIKVKDIYTEGIEHISHDDIEYATSLNLSIKLLAIAKKHDNSIEMRVHPTLISNDHPLASVNSIYNAVYLNADPLGNILLSGEGAGQMAAASGVISDLTNLASQGNNAALYCNNTDENTQLTVQKIDDSQTEFYLRFMATDKPGVLAQVTSILGEHGIGINSVTQKAHNPAATVPVIMLTDYTTEKILRTALNKIHKLTAIKSKPVAIHMEKKL
ncbi:Homoserine dehydrogenase [hydrothermal vent metagenome]|uniref:Homoserine dehydrogenase n=1 Tax=hydrothermal vent metagenome TaxID=652676 RepID=A0A3B1DLA5_9ZZZZ